MRRLAKWVLLSSLLSSVVISISEVSGKIRMRAGPFGEEAGETNLDKPFVKSKLSLLSVSMKITISHGEDISHGSERRTRPN